MAWERRGGGRYYYKKIRMGRRVVSHYCGGGAAAVLQASADLQARRKRAAERENFKKFKHEQENIDQEIAQLWQTTAIAIKAYLRTAGFHCHRGTWRRRRKVVVGKPVTKLVG
jgi:hypothetical protein